MFFSVVVTSCEKCDCPPDTKLGDVYLDQMSLDMVPYRGHPLLYFKNQTGDTMVLSEMEFADSIQKIVISFDECDRPFRPAMTYWDGHVIEYRFKSDSINIQLLLWPTNLLSDTSLFDFFTVNANYNSLAIEKVTSLRGKSVESLTPEDTLRLKAFDRYSFADNVQLNSRTFRNVFYSILDSGLNSTPLEIYYTVNEGIVGFKVTNSTVWVLDHIE